MLQDDKRELLVKDYEKTRDAKHGLPDGARLLPCRRRKGEALPGPPLVPPQGVQQPAAIGPAVFRRPHQDQVVLVAVAYLHVGTGAPAAFRQEGRRALALFGSTSPSYLILQSLDLCSRYLAGGYRAVSARAAISHCPPR